MEELSYTLNMETLAAAWVKDCPLDKVKKADTKTGRTTYIDEDNKLTFAQMIDKIGDEGDDFDYDSNSCDDKNCLNYKQVIWANTKEVGCAKMKCAVKDDEDEDNEKATLMACFYTPT
ncbi:unnamed protein product [Mesocestoides corti]|nr:unnamed protein product [Mesocestoides corti]